MDSLRLDSGVKKIEVNEEGEYISINLSDNAFFERFNGFINWFDKKQIDIEQKAAELQKKYPEQETMGEETEIKFNFQQFDDYSKLYKEICDEVSKKLDDLFGAECLHKVFPDVQSPGFELICDFLDAVTPYLEKYAKKRNEKINTKYNRKRKGARS